ncbi:MAG: stalk domain-containing protein [Methanobacterium sp.]
MKHFLAIILIFLLTLIPLSQVLANDDFPVYMNGEIIVFDKEKPCMVQGELFIPIRDVMEKTVATITWDSLNNAAIIKLRNIVITVPVDKDTTIIKTPLNAYMLQSNYKTFIKNNTLLVPVDLIAEIFQSNIPLSSSNHNLSFLDNIPEQLVFYEKAYFLSKENNPINNSDGTIVDYTSNGMAIIQTGVYLVIIDDKNNTFFYCT